MFSYLTLPLQRLIYTVMSGQNMLPLRKTKNERASPKNSMKV